MASRIEDTVRRVLSGWTLYRPEHYVHVCERPGFISIEYFAAADWHFRAEDLSAFSLNVQGLTLYLLHIRLRSSDRGKGLGSGLYSAIEEIAYQLGCARIEQTPSGWTPDGDTRANYLKRRGWLLASEVAYKTLC